MISVIITDGANQFTFDALQYASKIYNTKKAAYFFVRFQQAFVSFYKIILILKYR